MTGASLKACPARERHVTAVFVITFLCVSAVLFAQNPDSSKWEDLETALGRTGTPQSEDVVKFSMPRSDMHVTVQGVPIKAGLALGSWVAFQRMGSGAMVMGDLVLSEEEVEPVMLKLQNGGIQQTALHNHVLHETPRVMYMHIAGHGDPVKLANEIREALNLTKTPPPQKPQPAQELALDTAQIDSILGYKGKSSGGVYQVSVPRAEEIKDEGAIVPPYMGVATGLNFQPTGNGRAAITGDFVLLGGEVNPVIKALRENGIEVTAIHSHMLTEEPRLFFMHFWANDDALKLAKGLRAALDKTNSLKQTPKR